MNILQITLLTFAGIIAFILVYIEYRSNGFGGYYEKRQRKRQEQTKTNTKQKQDVKEYKELPNIWIDN